MSDVREPIYFFCPACGGRFKVAKETSERIFCSKFCRDFGRAAVGGGTPK